MAKLMLLLITALLCTELAQAADCRVVPAFANGVWTPEPYANEEAVAVASRLAAGKEPVDASATIVLYHRDDGLNNLSEVFRLKEEESSSGEQRLGLMDEFFDVMGLNAKSLKLFGAGATIPGPIESYLYLHSFSDEIRNRVTSQTAKDGSVLAQAFAKGRPVLVVAHSMGNLYTNAAVISLGSQLRPGMLGVVGVGVPSAYVVTGDRQINLRLVSEFNDAKRSTQNVQYVTNTDDWVINTLRKSGPLHWKPPLKANTKNDKFDPPGHAFIDIYWNERLKTGDKAVRMAMAAVDKLNRTCGNQTETITATANLPGRGPNSSSAVTSTQQASSAGVTEGGGSIPTADLPPPRLPFPDAQKEGDSAELPEAVLTSIAKNFPEGRVTRAAQAFARASLGYWLSVARRGWQYDEEANFVLGEAQVCLRSLIHNSTKEVADVGASYIRLILAPLTAKPSLFEKFSNADAVASGHPVILNLEQERACSIARVP